MQLALLVIFCLLSQPTQTLPRYDTRYYVIYTDLHVEAAREATIRVTKMAEVYADRTRGFSGVINKKFPFVLYKKVEDYLAAGGTEGSAGWFNGSSLVAVAGALLGAVYGREAIPRRWRRSILSCHPIEGIHGVLRPRPAPSWPVDALELAEGLLLVAPS